MTRKNEFVRMNWWHRAPHLTLQDVAIMQSELRRLYPTLVMFPYSHHFHELGEDPRRPEFVDDLVEHFTPRIGRTGQYAGIRHLALRVPWPEDVATGNPQRLIGRPHRRPYQDSKEAFRRFGRTVYFRTEGSDSLMMLSGTTIEPPRDAIAALCNMPAEGVRPFRVLASLGSFGVELPHDTEDPEVVSFAKTVASILSSLTVRTSCTYDGLSGEILMLGSHQPISKSFLQRCALETDLHLHVEGIYRNRPCFSGPTPAQRWKWRREAGMPPEIKPVPLQVPKLLPHESLKWWRENVRSIPIDLRLEMNKMANRALFDQVSARTPGLERPVDSAIPRILPETDIWSER